MLIALSILHVIIGIILILVVLLQTGKGSDIGAAFGGGSSQTVFGSRGAATFLSKVTSAVAFLFMLSSLILAVYSGRVGTSSVVTEERARQAVPAPAAPPPAAQPSPPAQTPPATK
jgi:preprotein translocase subunit SecG